MFHLGPYPKRAQAYAISAQTGGLQSHTKCQRDKIDP